jgi:nucleoside-diphosphate-sugar epimerase
MKEYNLTTQFREQIEHKTKACEKIYNRGLDIWPKFEGKKIFVAGHTGFYGGWIFLFLNYLKMKNISFEINGGSQSTGWKINDCSTYTQFQKEADYVINCVGSSSPDAKEDELFEQHTAGAISLASSLKKGAVMLYISSGVVGSGSPPSSYSRAKESAEWFLKDMGANVRIVRPFATVGPGMGLDKHFAISKFIRQKLKNEPLKISENVVLRSFVHISDLLVQFFYVLTQDSREPFEVGSDDPITIADAARLISDNVVVVKDEFPSNAGKIYSADLTRIKKEFNFKLDYDSKSAILDTLRYYEGF